MIYYIADIHFGHKNILKYDSRPFKTIEEHDKTIIRNWNNTVSDDDDVYILGDFEFKAKNPPFYYLEQLNGRLHLVIGNHDSRIVNDTDCHKYFTDMNYMYKIQDGDDTVILCHYPIADWENMHHKNSSYHIYGHIHSIDIKAQYYMRGLDKCFNVCATLINYTPITLLELKFL